VDDTLLPYKEAALPEKPRDFEARVLRNEPVGSYFRLTLEDADGALASALPGQFISLKVRSGVAPLLRRPFSIARLIPGKGKARQVEVLYAVLKEGTQLLSQKTPGETVGVLGPLGKPFPHLDKRHPAILVGGGVGIAPMVFLAEYLTRKKVPVAVFLGAKTAEDLLDLKVFRSLRVPLSISTDDGTAGQKGFVTERLEEYLASGQARPGSIIHSCGPRPMFKAVSKVAERHGIKAYLSWEERMACGLGICLTCACPVKDGEGVKMERTCVEGPAFESSRVAWERLS
jgi:dihydroorotate dehydrogenase electron transfer subunit